MLQRKYIRAKRAYEFFCQYSASQETFTMDTMSLATGLSLTSISTYITKRWKSYLSRSKDLRYSVSPLFACISLEKFLQDFSQNRYPDAPVSDLRTAKQKAVSAVDVVILLTEDIEDLARLRTLRDALKT